MAEASRLSVTLAYFLPPTWMPSLQTLSSHTSALTLILTYSGSRSQTQHTQNASGCIVCLPLFLLHIFPEHFLGKRMHVALRLYQQIKHFLSGLQRWLCGRELALLPEDPSLGSSTHARRLTACNSHSMPPDALFGLQEHLYTCTYPLLTHTNTHTLKFLKN